MVSGLESQYVRVKENKNEVGSMDWRFPRVEELLELEYERK